MMLIPSHVRPAIVGVIAALAGCHDAPRADTVPALVSQTGTPVGAVSAVAQTSTPQLPRASQRPALLIGATTAWLDSTTMAEAGTALGMHAIVGDTARHDALMTACYSARAGADEVTVRMEAFGFVDPDATKRKVMAAIAVSKASIARGPDVRPPSEDVGPCAPIPVPPSEVRWQNGLRVGMTRAEVRRILGRPKQTDEEGESLYEYDDPRPRRHACRSSDRPAPGHQRVREVRDSRAVRWRRRHAHRGELLVGTQLPGRRCDRTVRSLGRPVVGRWDDHFTPTRRRAAGALIGAASVWLDSTSLGQAVDALGRTGMAGRREDHVRVMNACYSSGAGQDRVKVVLTGEGPVDAAPVPSSVSAMPVRRVAMARGFDPRRPSSITTPCFPLPVRESEILWSNGLRLGMARSEAERLLGHAKTAEGQSVYSNLDRYEILVGYENDAAARIEVRYVMATNR
jgi:hypothetical protein